MAIDAMPPVVLCGECGSPMVLRPSRYGLFYGCSTFPACRGTHGAHPDGSPLGTPTDAATKKERIIAHEYFDHLWRSGLLKRKRAYVWLCAAIGPTRPDGTSHISDMDMDECHRTIEAILTEFAGWLDPMEKQHGN